MAYYVLQTRLPCPRSGNYSHLLSYRLTHIIFLSQTVADKRPGCDPTLQLIKACTAGIPHFWSAVTLPCLSKACLSRCPSITLIPCVFYIISISSAFLHASATFVPSVSLSFIGEKSRRLRSYTRTHTHIHCNTQLRHQSLRWPSFRLEPYLKLKLFPPQNAVAAPFCLLIIVLKRLGNAMLFEMGSPCYCQPYRRSVPHVMELRVD